MQEKELGGSDEKCKLQKGCIGVGDGNHHNNSDKQVVLIWVIMPRRCVLDWSSQDCWLQKVLILQFCATAVAAFFPEQCSNDTDVMDHLLAHASARYNRHKLPSRPVIVRIEMWIQEVTYVSELSQDFEIGSFRWEFSY